MAAWIKSPELGYFVGECLGLGFFESHIECGDCGPEEQPIEFENVEEAQSYLDSWVGGPCGCYVSAESPKEE